MSAACSRSWCVATSCARPDRHVGGAVAEGGAFALSGAGLLELMVAALARGASVRFTARGFSMDPFVRDGDVLTVAPVRRRPGLGRVVAVRDAVSGRLVVHRVVAHATRGVLVRGDAAGQADGVADPPNVLGVVVAVERRGRRVRLGCGPERMPLARLSRAGLLAPLVARARWVRHALSPARAMSE
jgi:hypothetical protein